MFEDYTEAIQEKIDEANKDNYEEMFGYILNYHKDCIREAKEVIDHADESFIKEQQACNMFRTLMLSPAVIKKGLDIGVSDQTILNENYLTRKLHTWKDAAIEVVIEAVRLYEIHLKFYAGLAAQSKSKSEIKKHILDTKDIQTQKIVKLRKEGTKEGKAVSKAVRNMMKTLGLDEKAATAMVDGMKVKKKPEVKA